LSGACLPSAAVFAVVPIAAPHRYAALVVAELALREVDLLAGLKAEQVVGLEVSLEVSH